MGDTNSSLLFISTSKTGVVHGLAGLANAGKSPFTLPHSLPFFLPTSF